MTYDAKKNSIGHCRFRTLASGDMSNNGDESKPTTRDDNNILNDDSTKEERKGELIALIDELWVSVLSRPPSVNSLDLWREHGALRKAMGRVEELQDQEERGRGQWKMKRLLARTDSDERRNRKCSIKAFVEWSRRMEIDFDGVEIVECGEEEELGLRTVKTLRRDEVIVRVPRRAMLTVDMARKSSMLRQLMEKDVIASQMENVSLALFLAGQMLKEENDHWKPYLEILPLEFTTPLYFSEEQFQSLRPSPLFDEALLFYRNVARQFVYFHMIIQRNEQFEKAKKSHSREAMAEPLLIKSPFTIDNFTFVLYRWAVACVSTRINPIPSESSVCGDKGGQKMIPALIPMLDLANHEFSPNNMPDSVHFSVDDDSAVIMALKDYSPGDDITIFYGLRSSGEFLLHNGFVPDGLNPSDRYRLKIGLPKSDPLLRERLRLFQSIGFSNAEKSPLFSFELTPAVPVPDSLVQFSRAFVVKIVEDNGDSLTSKENQLKAWTFLRDRFQLLIRAYGTIEEDPQRNNSNKSLQESSIVRLKLAELRILKAAQDLVEGKLQ